MESISSTNKQKMAKLPEQVNVSLINASSIMYNNSKKYSFLTYGNLSRETLFVQSPLFEKQVEVQNYGEYTEHYYEIPNNKSGNAFLMLINNIEQRLIQLAFENKNNWFNSKENVKFRSVIKCLEDNENKVIKFRIPYNIKTKRIFVESYDVINPIENETITIRDITDGQTRIIININAVWFTDDMFGLYLRPVYVEEIKQCEYQFQDQYNDSFFIDSEVVPHENVVSKNAQHLNGVLSELQELDNDEHEVDLDQIKQINKSFKSNGSNSSNRSNRSNRSTSVNNKKMGRKMKTYDVTEDNSDSEKSSDSEFKLDFD